MGIGQNFGNKAEEYSKARRGLPEEFFSYLKNKAAPGKNVLDIGCGTGIVTRKLKAAGFEVTGSDIDEGMIRQAELDSAKEDIKYVVASANNLPFGSEAFDIVVASSAFHWFHDVESVSEIKRVLRKGGLFAIANKHNGGFVRNFIIEVAGEYIPNHYLPSKKGYEPKSTLLQNNFENVEEKSFSIKETYSIEEMVLYAQSISIWSLVPKENESDIVKKLRIFLSEKFPEGVIQRESDLRVVTGYKPE